MGAADSLTDLFDRRRLELELYSSVPSKRWERNLRILVIDDSLPVGMAIQMLLNREGCDVVLAESGPLGAQAFAASAFDQVMVDLFMPDMDGLETIKLLRRLSLTVPIVAMSGFRFRDTTGERADYLGMALALGANHCLRKPFGAQQLIATINPRLGGMSSESIGTRN